MPFFHLRAGAEDSLIDLQRRTKNEKTMNMHMNEHTPQPEICR